MKKKKKKKEPKEIYSVMLERERESKSYGYITADVSLRTQAS